MKFGQKVLGKALFAEIMKRTFYGQFVAGPVSLQIFDRKLIKSNRVSGHGWDSSDDSTDAQLRGEEHPGLQRGGGHQPGGGREEGDGVSSSSWRLH